MSTSKDDFLKTILPWNDLFIREVRKHFSEANASSLEAAYRRAFDISYQANCSFLEAIADLPYLESLTPENPIHIRLNDLKVKVYHYETALSLSDMLPVLDNLGLQPASETSFRVLPAGKKALWIHDFTLKDQHDNWLPEVIPLVVEAFQHTWQGQSENDGLNRLIALAQLDCSQVMILRGYLHYFKQIKFPYSAAYCEEALIAYPNIAREIINLFLLKFTPSNITDANQQQLSMQENNLANLLQDVINRDHDRILRQFLMIIQATLRTNYFQEPLTKEIISFKLDSSKVADLPHPHPWVEVFIYSPRFQAIHLRGSKVSRGGIRWSERPEDFRTEILGLMKAQSVKNSIIVPLGAKGGFVLKNPARFANRQQLQEEVVACYSLMMQNLLDLCDNRVDATIIPPRQVVRYDEDDTYLVVAADKGTSTFSDIANRIASDHHFWLDDAFASGGSTGYDHKEMGITAKGAWESVKRHFRELNHDVESQDFTVIGIGDMSGDIFGNLMRSHQHTQLLAAFNHQHIFLDPTPDLARSLAERQRLFHLPYSTWADYQPHILSQGGGIFLRTQKMIHLSPEVRTVFSITEEALSPEKLIQKLLQAPVDLLWFGGIGTFIKASNEPHAEASDPNNDSLRIDAKALKARVIGEGANLGLTQKARIEYALHGGKINADFIDNSAGVDCSDHEVNIKILFHKPLREGTLTIAERNALLRDMTGDITQLILQDNYQQAQVISKLEQLGAEHWGRWQNLIGTLENIAKLDRNLECLPSDDDIERRIAHGQGPMRPEIAVLLSYSKNALYSLLLTSSLCDNPFYESHLLAYFPKILQEKFPQAIQQHPLRREIIATTLANILINRMGPLFVIEHIVANENLVSPMVDAFFCLHNWLNLDDIWRDIEAMDNQIAATQQMQAFQTIHAVLINSITRFTKTGIDYELPSGIYEILETLPPRMTDKQRQDYTNTANIWQDFPQPLANKLQQISLIPDFITIYHLARIANKPLKTQAKLYFQVSEACALGSLQNALSKAKGNASWQKSLIMSLSYDVVKVQAKIILSDIELKQWLAKYSALIPRFQALQPDTDLAYFSFLIGQLNDLI